MKLKEFFKTRSAAFYVAAAAAVLSVILSIVYACCYGNTEYMSWFAFALTLIAGLAFFALALFRQTQAFASAVTGLLDFIGFLLFIRGVYWYFSTVFFGGFKASLLGEVDPAFYAVTVLYVVTIAVSNVCVYLRIAKKQKTEEIQATAEVEKL